MKKIIYSLSALLTLVTAGSCKKQLMTYEGLPDIYFNEAARLPAYSGEVLTDSTVLSFSLALAKDSVKNIVVAVTGAPADHDREYSLTINSASTAVEGTHYTPIPKTLTIKKNKLLDTIPVKFFRTTDLRTRTVTLLLDLQANSNFVNQMNNKVLDKQTGKVKSFITYRIYVNDMLKKPKLWFDGYLGVFTQKKLNLIMEILKITPAYLDATASLGEQGAYGGYMQRYLNEMKTAGQTIYEDDGTEMMMGQYVQ
ncbi:hypothetical protein TH53_25440 [Pedobacter lusitanus]|uniref:Contig157, whole genome shotgun sequence n=1 Tax=Pedobacter lusitanus TaxID=1503925 RepID=A0A0D0GJK2_9SPHI|nr:DUF4843 domain-containing protein [Pedobacter lusitanus]KIO74606.1 hypothetical protein TH53_25440 [Pedobacter lusitanus]